MADIITKDKGVYSFRGTKLAAKNGDEAMIEVNKLLGAEEVEKAAAAARPLAFSTTWKGKFSVRPNDREVGSFPYVELHPAQVEQLLANIDDVRAAYEQAKAGKLHNQKYPMIARWQDAPKGTNPDKVAKA